MEIFSSSTNRSSITIDALMCSIGNSNLLHPRRIMHASVHFRYTEHDLDGRFRLRQQLVDVRDFCTDA